MPETRHDDIADLKRRMTSIESRLGPIATPMEVAPPPHEGTDVIVEDGDVVTVEGEEVLHRSHPG
jgi:hypothetical protein